MRPLKRHCEKHGDYKTHKGEFFNSRHYADCPICHDEYLDHFKITSRINSTKAKLWYKTLRSDEQVARHTNEKCSGCDKPINFEEWFCYCSLCPDCYLQTPEEELDKIDKQLFDLVEGAVKDR